jgi:hypothetical protein
MSNWIEIPNDWQELPPKFATQRNVMLMIAAGVVETRHIGGVLEWRRKPTEESPDHA